MLQVVRASAVVGTAVKNHKDENLGRIEDVMLDVAAGRVAYAVLSFGGFLGLGDKLFALPWGALRFDRNCACYRLSMEKERLEGAPGFDKDAWPDTSHPHWADGLHEFYGVSRS